MYNNNDQPFLFGSSSLDTTTITGQTPSSSYATHMSNEPVQGAPVEAILDYFHHQLDCSDFHWNYFEGQGLFSTHTSTFAQVSSYLTIIVQPTNALSPHSFHSDIDRLIILTFLVLLLCDCEGFYVGSVHGRGFRLVLASTSLGRPAIPIARS